MNSIRLLFILTVVLFCFASSKICAQNYKNEIGFTTDNDLYHDVETDKYYTNGLLLHFRYALKQDTITTQIEKRLLEFEIGQKIFTPYWAQVPDPKLQDRPFTAFLYTSGTYSKFYKNEKVWRFSAVIGTIGPNAKGREVQEGYHKKLKIYTVMGWEYQLKNEIGVNLSAEYSKLLYRLPNKIADLTGTSAALLGNTFSGANVGVLFRFGKINPLYKSVSYNSSISNNGKINAKPKAEFLLFARPQLNYVAYDATIQGGLFLKDKGPVTFKPKPFVLSTQVGITVSIPKCTVFYSLTFKSKDVKSAAVPYTYGSIGLLYRFNL